MSPRVRARMAELQLTTADLAGIIGTGSGNRVTIRDLENFLHKIENQTAQDASAIRAGVADAMRRSWTRPLATVALPVVFDPLLQHRKSSNPRPGPALYALRALALALAENSAPAGRLIGSKIIHPSSIDVGFAVEAEEQRLLFLDSALFADQDAKTCRVDMPELASGHVPPGRLAPMTSR